MRIKLVAGVTALALVAASALTVSSAEARGGGGFHRGYHGGYHRGGGGAFAGFAAGALCWAA